MSNPLNTRYIHIESFILLGFLAIIIFSCTPKLSSKLVSSTKALQAKSAMVVSAHPIASEVGKAILKKGGNAVDAAVAVQYALAVVYPNAGNIGGGGFMMYRSADGGVSALDYREKAPSAATQDMYLDPDGKIIPRLSLDGHLAAGVPGTIAGMHAAHERYGTLPMAELIQPAIELARDGFLLTQQQAEGLNSAADAFRKLNKHTPIFLKETPWKAGDRLIQKDLSNTLLQISLSGPAGFYKGKVADLIVAEMTRGGGIITLEDLANYQAKWRTPILMNYKSYSLISMPPPSSGGIAIAEMLGMLANYDLASMGFQSPEATQLIVEAERRAYADRATHLGDSDFYDVPQKELMDSEYLKNRMADFSPGVAGVSSNIEAGNFAPQSEETTHFSIIDADGNAVSITTTLNASYGSKTVVEGAGFILNNEMDDFSSKPGEPNFYGLIGAEANAIQPNKRMLSSMTPTIITKDGKLNMVVGTPGGSTIITSVLQVFLNVAEFKLNINDAVNLGRFHHQWVPDVVYHEQGSLSTETITALEKMGYTLKERGAIGRVEAIMVNPDGTLTGAADSRGDDSVAGY